MAIYDKKSDQLLSPGEENPPNIQRNSLINIPVAFFKHGITSLLLNLQNRLNFIKIMNKIIFKYDLQFL